MSSDSNAARITRSPSARDRLGRDADARFVGGGQEERPQERTMDTLAEGQLSWRASTAAKAAVNRGVSSSSGRSSACQSADEIHGLVRSAANQDRPGAPVKPDAGPMPEHLLPARPALRGMTVQRAIDDEVRHLLDDVA